nr:EOG090X09TV [Macrothrix elegans]
MVLGVYHTYYEMKIMKPKFQALRIALAKFPYKGKENETDSSIGFSFSELKSMIQASEEELLNKLQELHAVKIKGKWRLLDVGFMFGWVSYLDTILREKDTTLEDVASSDVADWMSMYEPEDINTKCMSLYMVEIGDSLKWNSAAVSQLFALYLLPDLKAFDSNDFFNAWKQAVPVGVTPREEDLFGVALVDYDSTPSLVRYLPEFELPEDVVERLEVLFRNRPKWTLQAITPYLQPLTDTKSNVAALLTKYARASTINGIKYYSSKYSQ